MNMNKLNSIKLEYDEEPVDQIVPWSTSADHSNPLKGAVICCTSVSDEKRTAIIAYAEQMGARYLPDLTVDVTHLIVGSYDTLKYQYVARQRQDVLPMAIEWIEAVRELWIHDQEIDVEALERQYILPTFHSLIFSITGCENYEERLQIAQLVKANGAVYQGDLSRSITHLISFRTEGPKYKAAKSWGLKIVSVEWLHDSIERGMILDEKLYDPALAVEERGRGAWDRSVPKKTSCRKRSKQDSPASYDGSKRKLRRTASSKLSGQCERILADISGVNSVPPQLQQSSMWETDDVTITTLDPKSTRQKPEPAVPSAIEIPPRKTGIFSGSSFHIYDFPRREKKILENHLISHDGEVQQMMWNELSDKTPPKKLIVIISHDLPKSRHPRLPDFEPAVEIVTFWWVERCLHYKKFMEPGDHVIGRPFPVFPIPDFGANNMIICSSAFSGVDLLHVKKAVRLIGANYSDNLTPNTSVLIAESIARLRTDKFNFAMKWKIPVVTANWLWDCIDSGKKLSMTEYFCHSPKKKSSVAGANLMPMVVSKPVGAKDEAAEFSGQLSTSSIESLCKARIDRTEHTGEARCLEGDESVPIPQLRQIPEKPEFFASKAEDLACKPQALSERNPNSPTRTVSTAPVPSNHAYSCPSEGITSAISSLLAKSKSSTATASAEPTESRKRSRILGRVTSNISTTSRATSVDSTATHGHPVEWPSSHTSKDQTANERIDMLIKGDRSRKIHAGNEDSQMPSTQLEYDDPDSTVATAALLARIRGEEINLEMPKKEEKTRIGEPGRIAGQVKGKRRGRSGAVK